jgi:hypothetical protein
MPQRSADSLPGAASSWRSDLVELVEELGPALVQDVAARTYPAREPERRIAAATLKQALWPRTGAR